MKMRSSRKIRRCEVTPDELNPTEAVLVSLLCNGHGSSASAANSC
jgi:hypothetical protein